MKPEHTNARASGHKKEARFRIVEISPSLFERMVRTLATSARATEAGRSAVAGLTYQLSLNPILKELAESGFHVAGLGRSASLNISALENLGLRASHIPFSYELIDRIIAQTAREQSVDLLQRVGNLLSAEHKLARMLHQSKPVTGKLAKEIAGIFGPDRSQWPTILFDLFARGGQQQFLLQPKVFQTRSGEPLASYIHNLKSLLSDEVLSLVGAHRPSRFPPSNIWLVPSSRGQPVATRAVEPLLERIYRRMGFPEDFLRRLRVHVFDTGSFARPSQSVTELLYSPSGPRLGPVNARLTPEGKADFDNIILPIARTLEAEAGIPSYLQPGKYPANLTVLRERLNAPGERGLEQGIRALIESGAVSGRAAPTIETRSKLERLIDLLFETPKVEFPLPVIPDIV